MAHATLPSGRKMPLNGFGTWKADADATTSAVLAALEAGYRHIDCAAVYLNEAAVGAAFAAFFARGDVPRSQVFITSKVWNSCHAPDKVVAACEQSLHDLQLDYVDLYLVHHPYAWEYVGLPITEDNWVRRDDAGKIAWGRGVTLEMTWRGMEACVDKGLARDIGVSNYPATLLMDLLQYARIAPAVNQCEAHVYNAREELRHICDQAGVHFTMYSILGSGKEGPLGDAVVASVAKRNGATPAQVLIAWGLAKGCSVLAKSTRKERIAENFDAARVALSEDDVAALDGLERGMRCCDMNEYWGFASHA